MEWDVGGLTATVDELSMNHRTVTVRHTVTDKIEAWRDYRRADDVETVTGADGAFRALDRSGGAQSPTTVSPPANDEPTPFDSFEALVVDYAETQEAPGVFTVDLELARTSNRPQTVNSGGTFDLVFGIGSPSGHWESAPWQLDLSQGRIGLAEDQVLLSELDGDATASEWMLPILLDDIRARILMESLSNVDATAERTVPDGQNYVVDTTTTDRNTVELITPPRATVQSGTYVATGWDLAWYSHRRRWLVELSLSLSASSTGVFDLSFDTGLA